MPIEEKEPKNLTPDDRDFQDSAHQKCPQCNAAVEMDAQFCHNCGYSLASLRTTAPVAPVSMATPDPAIEKGIRQARTTLLVVAIIQIFSGLIFVAMQSQDTFAIAGVFIVSAVFFALWFWAKRNPLPATITGLITFVTLHVAEAMIDPRQIYQGIIMKILVVSFLAKGVSAAINYRNMQKQITNGPTAHP